ncbi:MAG TPA: NAD(P)/FAD-dependent oxidoreductase, partial [Candidatus Udaeobacter sp.]|nr:NAD(P)/FAD-dependent oxidoreductase [Candidatus Udaeobacter sp.]
MNSLVLEPAERYDVIVAGTGPGGSVAARECAQRGLRTLLLERRREIGTPLACAEAVRRAGFDRLTAIDPAWIASPIDGGRLVTPDDTMVVLPRPGAGMVLERPVFERHLAGEAVAAGASVLVDTPVLDLIRAPEGRGERVTGIRARVRGQERVIAATVVIAADGVESHLARRAGLTQPLPRDQFFACAQYLLAGPAERWGVEPGYADFLIGNRLAPGGYGWRFPKGAGRWNVGIAVTPADAADENPTEYLRRYVQGAMPEARVLGYVSGAIPAPAVPGPFAAPGLLLVGDAARLTEPLSGAGIAIAMESGVFAAAAAAAAVSASDPSLRVLRAYEERWRAERGREVAFYARARAFFRRLSDPD